jgi:hypothetical protein
MRGTARLGSTAHNFLTRPTQSAPRRALLPGEHILIVRVPRARSPVWPLPSPPFTLPAGKRLWARGRECSRLRASNEGFLKPRVARAGEHSRPLASNHTVKYCFTCSALNSVLLPDTTTAPLAITTYFSARRAAKWSPCSTNKMANRRCFLNPMITSSI